MNLWLGVETSQKPFPTLLYFFLRLVHVHALRRTNISFHLITTCSNKSVLSSKTEVKVIVKKKEHLHTTWTLSNRFFFPTWDPKIQVTSSATATSSSSSYPSVSLPPPSNQTQLDAGMPLEASGNIFGWRLPAVDVCRSTTSITGEATLKNNLVHTLMFRRKLEHFR